MELEDCSKIDTFQALFKKSDCNKLGVFLFTLNPSFGEAEAVGFL